MSPALPAARAFFGPDDGKVRCGPLAVATVFVDQCPNGSSGQADCRPIRQRIARFDGQPQQTSLQEILISGSSATNVKQRSQFSNRASVVRDSDVFTRGDAADEAAEIVLQVSNPNGCHENNIATCSYNFLVAVFVSPCWWTFRALATPNAFSNGRRDANAAKIQGAVPCSVAINGRNSPLELHVGSFFGPDLQEI